MGTEVCCLLTGNDFEVRGQALRSPRSSAMRSPQEGANQNAGRDLFEVEGRQRQRGLQLCEYFEKLMVVE